jgi:hypothetical protein
VNGGSNDDQPWTKAAGSASTRKTIMLDAAHLYFEGTAAAISMVAVGAISGLATLALSGDQRFSLLAAAGGFMLTGIVLMVRLWRMTQAPAPPTEPPA